MNKYEQLRQAYEDYIPEKKSGTIPRKNRIDVRTLNQGDVFDSPTGEDDKGKVLKVSQQTLINQPLVIYRVKTASEIKSKKS